MHARYFFFFSKCSIYSRSMALCAGKIASTYICICEDLCAIDFMPLIMRNSRALASLFPRHERPVFKRDTRDSHRPIRALARSIIRGPVHISGSARVVLGFIFDTSVIASGRVPDDERNRIQCGRICIIGPNICTRSRDSSFCFWEWNYSVMVVSQLPYVSISNLMISRLKVLLCFLTDSNNE